MATYRISVSANTSHWYVYIKKRGSGTGIYGWLDSLEVKINGSTVYSGSSDDFDFRGGSTQELIKSGSWSAGYGNNTIYAEGYDGAYASNFERWSDSTSVDRKFTHTLNYNANGGSGPPSSQTVQNYSTSSFSVTISSTVPTRQGFIFLGWNTNSSASTGEYQPGQTYTISGGSSTTLYAIWKVASNIYFNGTHMEEVYFNGVKMTEVYFNGTRYL